MVSLKAFLQPLRTQKTTVDKNYGKHKFKMCSAWCYNNYSTLYKQYFGHRSEQPIQERETGISENQCRNIYIETRVCSPHLLSLPSPQVAMKLHGGAEEQKVTVSYQSSYRESGRACGQLCVSLAIATACHCCHCCQSLHTVGVHGRYMNSMK